MKTLRIDLIALVVSAFAAAAAWAWCLAFAPENAPVTPALPFDTADYASAGPDVPEAKTAEWSPPRAQTGGWVYDLFTPPEIYYDTQAQEFRVTPPDVRPAAPAGGPFGLELLGVSRPLFRLQLVGFVGGEGSYRGLFENMTTTETFLATGGRRLPELGVVIESFDVQRTEVVLPGSMSAPRCVAVARVRDERTGETFLLTDARRLYAAAPIATVAVTGERTDARQVREGESFELAGTRYRLERVQLTPPAAEVVKESAGQLNSERRTLTPSSSTAAPRRESAS